ncbi:putative huntingtin-interacting protein K-like [Apostichopus japonicus]|uniref:Putative huntingtin-interacting protein K-like n=1 Tax=Stichopus japonicus TaxID=307972 RepID=A0A2G8L2J8_STIJA|nr:putative huntingtin-interacting protein K-like [Apostichopus japonicus]
MSTNGEQDEGEKDTSAPKVKKHDSGAADLERVTDYAEEQEISVHDMSNALAEVNEKRKARTKERAEMEKELAKVVIKKTDVDLIVNEMEISRTEAERSLRVNQGNVVNALIQLTN